MDWKDNSSGVGLKMSEPGIKHGGISTSSSQALPVASATYRGMFWFVEGGAGVEDVLYCCLKAEDDAYHWVQVSYGGLEV